MRATNGKRVREHEQKLDNKKLVLTLPASSFYDESVERALLGRMLTADPLPQMLSDISEEDFFLEEHRMLFRVISALYREHGTAWDDVILRDYIRKEGLEEKLPFDWILSIYHEACGDALYDTALSILKEKSLCRSVISLFNDEVRKMVNGSFELGSLLHRLYLLTERSAGEAVARNLLSIVSHYIAEVEKKLSRGEEIGVSIIPGWEGLMSLILGFERGEFVVIGGRPGMGKTSFALNLATNLYENGENVPVLFVEIEMTESQIAQRALARWGGISLYEARDGTWVKAKEKKEEVINRLMERESALSKVYLSTVSRMDIPKLSVEIAKAKAQHGVGVVIIDYIQLLGVGYHLPDPRLRVSRVSQELKRLAKKFNVLIIGLAQLSRETEKRTDKRPQLADLRESGQIEQDADIVMFLHRPEYYKKNPSPEEKGLLELIVAKNRQGKRGIIKFHYDGERQEIVPIGGGVETISFVDRGGEGGNNNYDDDYDLEF